MANILRDIFSGDTKMNKLVNELTEKSIKERSCYTCIHRFEEYMAYSNETGTCCRLRKKKSPMFQVDKHCKYYEQERGSKEDE